MNKVKCVAILHKFEEKIHKSNPSEAIEAVFDQLGTILFFIKSSPEKIDNSYAEQIRKALSSVDRFLDSECEKSLSALPVLNGRRLVSNFLNLSH